MAKSRQLDFRGFSFTPNGWREQTAALVGGGAPGWRERGRMTAATRGRRRAGVLASAESDKPFKVKEHGRERRIARVIVRVSLWWRRSSLVLHKLRRSVERQQRRWILMGGRAHLQEL